MIGESPTRTDGAAKVTGRALYIDGHHLTRALAVDLGGRVRVNNISPGAISTSMLEAGFKGRPEARRKLGAVHPLGRVGTPAEVAQAALFLASAAASNITGIDLRVDGGVTARLHDSV